MKSVSMYFSPTGGGEKIAKAIRRGMGESLDEGTVPYIFVVPVYGGHMPATCMPRMTAPPYWP